MKKNEKGLPIYMGNDEFERVNFAQNQLGLYIIKIKSKSFQKWIPNQFV